MTSTSRSPKRQSGRSSGMLLVMAPDSSRPDLRSPLGSMRSPSPGCRPSNTLHIESDNDMSHTNVDGYSGKSYSEDFEPTTAGTFKYSEDFETNTAAEYTEDFETATRSKPIPSPRFVRKPAHGGKLETVSVTSIGEDIVTVPYSDTFLEDTLDKDTFPATASGRTSRLTWQYSEDFTEDDRSTSRSNYSRESTDNDSSISYSSTDERTWTTSEQTADDEMTTDQTDEDAVLAEKECIQHLINKLKQTTQLHSDQERNDADCAKKERTTSKPLAVYKNRDEVKAYKRFYKNVVQKLKDDTKDVKCAQGSDLQDPVKVQLLGLNPDDFTENHGISHAAINKLRLENTKAKLEKMAKEAIHDPTQCADCLETQEELAQINFLKDKLHIATETRIKEQVEQAKAQDFTAELLKDPAIMPGRLHAELGHLDSWMIWNKLGKQSPHITPSPQLDSMPKPLSLSKKCPHINSKHRKHKDAAHSDEVLDHLRFTQREAESVKQSLTEEHNRLKELQPKDFWHYYFSKLQQFNGFPLDKINTFSS